MKLNDKKDIWSEPIERNLRKAFGRFAGEPIRFLEIGVFEGKGARWFQANVLTHADAQWIGIDPYSWEHLSRRIKLRMAEGKYARLVRHMLKIYNNPPKLTLYRDLSENVLHDGRIEPDSIDAMYIDGSHEFFNVLADSVLAWPLMKKNGVILWDNYPAGGNFPGVKKAVHAFLKIIPDQYEVIVRGRQFGIRKVV